MSWVEAEGPRVAQGGAAVAGVRLLEEVWLLVGCWSCCTQPEVTCEGAVHQNPVNWPIL